MLYVLWVGEGEYGKKNIIYYTCRYYFNASYAVR